MRKAFHLFKLALLLLSCDFFLLFYQRRSYEKKTRDAHRHNCVPLSLLAVIHSRGPNKNSHKVSLKELLKIPATSDMQTHEEALFKCWGNYVSRLSPTAGLRGTHMISNDKHASHKFSFLSMLSTHCQLITRVTFVNWECTQLCIIGIRVHLNGADLTAMFGTSSNNTRQSIIPFLEESQWRPINRSAIERPSAS